MGVAVALRFVGAKIDQVGTFASLPKGSDLSIEVVGGSLTNIGTMLVERSDQLLPEVIRLLGLNSDIPQDVLAQVLRAGIVGQSGGAAQVAEELERGSVSSWLSASADITSVAANLLTLAQAVPLEALLTSLVG